MRTWPSRYGLALITICGAVAAQKALEHATGFPHSFLLFYPTIFIVALVAGFGPGAVATLLALVAADCFYKSERGSLALRDETERVGLALFAIVGIALSWVADSLRRRTNRLQEFEKVVEDLEEMIVVVDQDYRYLIANRAFLKYRALARNRVIGRHVADVLDPVIFETKVKARLEECFTGRVVHYEMTFVYPELGERQLQVSYLPIWGGGGKNA